MSLVENWRKVCSRLGCLGSWYCSGKLKVPELKVNEVCLEPVITQNTWNRLESETDRASIGENNKSIIQAKELLVDPACVTFIKASAWKRQLDELKKELRRVYEKKNISLQFYKMFLYEEGCQVLGLNSFKDNTHFANLLISLPVEGGCEGEIMNIMGPRGSKEAIEWICDGIDANWCSFFADCHHEWLLQSRPGKFVVLAFQVFSTDKMEALDAQGSISTAEEEIIMNDVLDCALAQREYALILLDHPYSTCCDSANLKGFDRFLFEFLSQKYKTCYQLNLVGMELGAYHHYYECSTPHVDFEFLLGKNGDANELVGLADGTTFQHTDSYQYSDDCVHTLHHKDQLHFPMDAAGNGCSDESAEESLVRIKKRRRFDEYGDPNHRLMSTYFKHPKCAFMFNADDFEERTRFYHDYGGGYESPPEELRYKFGLLIVSKL